MLKKLLFIWAILVPALQSWGQSVTPQGVGVIYNRETAFNLRFATNRSISAGMEWGRLRTYYRTTLFYAGVGEIKSVKEQRQSGDPNISRSFRPYVYGKQNTMLVVRGGWGAKRYYSEKAKHKGVAVGISYGIGPSLGILKPYYLALRRPSPDNPGSSRVVHERYSESNASIFLDNTRILGAAPFTKGLKEISVLPGANATLAFHMDWGAFDEVVKALEIGLQVDVFPRKVPILVSEENSPVFFNFFVNLQLGKRQ